ncbi:MAG: nucleoside deaminase [Magnetococcus sp. YQC-9]
MTLEGAILPEAQFLPDGEARTLLALVLAAEAGAGDEVPVGALLNDALGRPVAGCGNVCLAGFDPVGHAEMRALRQAAGRVGNYRLTEASLQVSLEPCPLCREALALARVGKVEFAAHRLPQRGEKGTLAQASSALLRFFFRARRVDLNSDEDSAVMQDSLTGVER